MNAVIPFNPAEDEGFEAFFPPVDTDLIDQLIAEYTDKQHKIALVSETIHGTDLGETLPFFLDGNCRDNRGGMTHMAKSMFELEGALKSLDAAFWNKAFTSIGIWDDMPEKRREEWREKIRENKTAEFEETAVRQVLDALDRSRHLFLAERVDGIFRRLSTEHVTNRPEGFFKRMINNYCYEGLAYGSPYPSSRYVGYLHDFRCVIAKFMGRDQPAYNSSSKLLSIAYTRPGNWMTVDGGSFRLRAYKKGTVHIEVNPEFAYRMNMILAALYPTHIPSQFRAKPKTKPKEFLMASRPLPFAVVELLASFTKRAHSPLVLNTMLSAHDDEKLRAFKKEAYTIMEMIGGVFDEKHFTCTFDYDPKEVLEDIIVSGCIPDHKTHQFYPTPEELGRIAYEIAAEGDSDLMTWLEPSAGTGGLAKFMDPERTVCVEISKLHATILEARGYEVFCGDFLTHRSSMFDRVLMNPPFSEGRWKAHVEHAAGFLKPGGRLVAILPASAKNKDFLVGFDMKWSKTYDNLFEGTSVSVVILTADKK